MKKQQGFSVIELMIALCVIIGSVGWVWNIIKIINAEPALAAEYILRCLGVVFIPLGALMGFL